MSKPMTTRERVLSMYEHREADHVPITDSPWAATLERWHAQGLPKEPDWPVFFGLDRFGHISVDNSPRLPTRKIEETEKYSIYTTNWGVTCKSFKHAGGVPEFIDFTVVDADSWAKAKADMTPTRDRVNWDLLKREYPRWKEQGRWISAGFWFGFDVTHSWMIGTERALMAMAMEPEWLVDMWNTQLDLDLALFDMVWDAGYTFDCIGWPDDMGYKGKQFFSMNMYRNLLKPVHKRACDWARAKGIKVHLHSCGDIRPLVPELIEIGVDMLNPLEVKAGCDPIALKQQYGHKLAFHGGLNAVLYNDMDKLAEEMRRVIPVMKKNGGYMISSDHSVPDSVTLKQFQEFVRLAKELGKY